jgi:hypothetical protein
VIVAVIPVRVMQMPVNEVVDVIAMGHGLVTTTRPMHMARLVTGTAMLRRAADGIAG